MMRAIRAAALMCLAAAARAQVDPSRRFQLEGGYQQGLRWLLGPIAP